MVAFRAGSPQTRAPALTVIFFTDSQPGRIRSRQIAELLYGEQ
jgi:hypothetical protein